MSKKIKYGIWVEGTEDQANVEMSNDITNMQFYALLKFMLDMAFRREIDGVPEEEKRKILEHMISDAREQT